MAEKIIERPITDIIHESFIEYARAVIEDRALPDARDGLKPVQRRILYTMFLSGLTPDKPFRKSVTTVGEVMKSLHPHGDQSIYNAMVKLAQTFAKRYPLIHGHGNFGTLDDSPAAMRYTESKLSSVGMWMLNDINKNTVDMQNNYDDTAKEPLVLPAMIPNLIINGGSGIAVGIASEIPPHNIGETLDAIVAYIKNPKITVKELMQYIKGPDFPTGGIVSPQGLLECYETGNGKIIIRAKVNVEELPDNKRQLVITEIPYQVSKNNLISKMATYIEGRQTNDVVEIRDESDKSGIRIIIEMDRGGNAEQLLDELYKKTDLQVNYTYNMVALVNNKPKTMSIKYMIKVFVEHKMEIIKKRSEYDLQKAKDRVHVLEGLIKAVGILDKIIPTIRSSKSPKVAKENLMSKFGFTDPQASAILDLRLQRLTALEVETLQKEHKELLKTIKRLETILSNDKNILKEVEAELAQIKEAFSDERKTLVKEFDQVEIKTRIEKFTLQVNANGKVKKLAENYKGERGVVLKTDSTKNIFLFDAEGTILKFTGITLPQTIEKQILNLFNEDEIEDDADVIFLTSDGLLKKTAFSEYRAAKSDSQAIKLTDKAKVVAVFAGVMPTEMIVFTKKGMAIRFDHTDVRQIGRVSAGVRSIKLDDGDEVVGAFLIPPEIKKGQIEVRTDKDVVVIKLETIRKQSRSGKGVKALKTGIIKEVLGYK